MQKNTPSVEQYGPNEEKERGLTIHVSEGAKTFWTLSWFLTLGITGIVHIVLRNNLIQQKVEINSAWSDINVQLKKRHDVLIKLVDAAKQYISYEKGLQTQITELRKMNVSQDPVKANDKMSSLFSGFVAVAENYPQLKAVETVNNLMSQSSYLESEIAAARRLYNSRVSIYNVRLKQFPTNVPASSMHLQRVSFFKVADDDKKDVDINLGYK